MYDAFRRPSTITTALIVIKTHLGVISTNFSSVPIHFDSDHYSGLSSFDYRYKGGTFYSPRIVTSYELYNIANVRLLVLGLLDMQDPLYGMTYRWK